MLLMRLTEYFGDAQWKPVLNIAPLSRMKMLRKETFALIYCWPVPGYFIKKHTDEKQGSNMVLDTAALEDTSDGKDFL